MMHVALFPWVPDIWEHGRRDCHHARHESDGRARAVAAQRVVAVSRESAAQRLVLGRRSADGAVVSTRCWYCSRGNSISFVIPASALSYVVGTFGAKYISLREECERSALDSVFCWCARGVALVAAGIGDVCCQGAVLRIEPVRKQAAKAPRRIVQAWERSLEFVRGIASALHIKKLGPRT